MMKKKYLLVFPLIAFAIFACHKEFAKQDSPDKKLALSIDDAKHYMDSTLKSTSPDVVLQSVMPGQKTMHGFLFWAKAKTLSTGKFTVVELPFASEQRQIPIYRFRDDYVKEEPDVSVATASFTRLIIYKNMETKTVDKKIITYLPDKSYLEAHHGDASNNWLNKFDHDFSGYVEYRNFDGSLMYVVRMMSGYKVAKYQISELKTGTRQDIQSYARQQTQSVKKVNGYTCYNTQTDYYTYSCQGDGEGNMSNCSGPFYDYSSYGLNCVYSDDGGGNYTSPDPGNSGAPSGGSGDGSSAPPSQTPAVQTNIFPPWQDARPCVHDILSTLVWNQYIMTDYSDNLFESNPVKNMFNFIRNNSTYLITFQESLLVNQNAFTRSVNNLAAVTDFDSNYISNATDLSLVRTIIHESVHVYFTLGLTNSNFASDPAFGDFATMNTLLFDTSGNPVNANLGTPQHQQMAATYVAGIADMLVQYANAKGITSPDPNRTISQYCTDLAWGGLFNTPTYMQLPTTDRIRIENTVLNEQNNKPGASTAKSCH